MKKVLIIASAFKAENDLLTNYIAHKTAKNALANFGLKAKEGVGAYEGVQELNLVIEMDTVNTTQISILKTLFFVNFAQDAILFVNAKTASLILKDGDFEELGNFHEVSEAEALETRNFTFIEGRYFIAKKENLPVWGERSPE